MATETQNKLLKSNTERSEKVAKLEITVEVADNNILGLMAKVNEKRKELNIAIAELENCFTAKYGSTYSNVAAVKEVAEETK